MQAIYFIRPGGNYSPEMYPTLQAAIDAAIAITKDTGYSTDVFDNTEKRGIVAHVGADVKFISKHAIFA